MHHPLLSAGQQGPSAEYLAATPLQESFDPSGSTHTARHQLKKSAIATRPLRSRSLIGCSLTNLTDPCDRAVTFRLADCPPNFLELEIIIAVLAQIVKRKEKFSTDYIRHVLMLLRGPGSGIFVEKTNSGHFDFGQFASMVDCQAPGFVQWAAANPARSGRKQR